jgi:hypothetical protein
MKAASEPRDVYKPLVLASGMIRVCEAVPGQKLIGVTSR